MNLDSIEAKAKEQYPYTRQQDGEVHASLDGSNWWVYYGTNTILEDTMFSSSAPPSAGSQAGDAALLAQRLRLNEFYDAPMLKRCIADIEAYAERLATEARIDEHSVIDGLGGFNTDKLPVLEQRVKELSATLTGKAE